MKLMIDSANITRIEEIIPLGVTSGITTNPSILNKEMGSRNTQIEQLLSYSTHSIYVQLVGTDVDAMMNDYIELRTRFFYAMDQIVFKIPIHDVGIKVIKLILEKNPSERILGTTIYSFTQAILAIMAGCESLAIYYNRILLSGEDPNAVIRDIRNYIDFHQYRILIIGASFKSSKQIQEALLFGANSCTIAPSLFKEMLFDDNVEKDARVFEEEHESLTNKMR